MILIDEGDSNSMDTRLVIVSFSPWMEMKKANQATVTTTQMNLSNFPSQGSMTPYKASVHFLRITFS